MKPGARFSLLEGEGQGGDGVSDPTGSLAGPLLSALRSLFHPAIALMVALPFVVALLLWSGLLIAFWQPWSRFFAAALRLDRAANFLAAWHLDWIAVGSNATLLLALFAVATLLTALLIVTMIAMPVMVRVVAAQDYPDLVPKYGGTALGSVVNALVTFFIYIPVWFVTLVLWLLPPGGQILSLIATGWLNARLFRYDALAEHASREEYQAILEGTGARFLTLGVIVAGLQWVPIANLIAPVYAGLVFVHAGLRELRRVRAARFRTLPATVLRVRS